VSGWIGLSTVVAEFLAPDTWPRAERPDVRAKLLNFAAGDDPLRERIAALAVARYGAQVVDDAPLINAAALALAMTNRGRATTPATLVCDRRSPAP